MTHPGVQVGTVGECWRYPVKSIQGARQERVLVTATGVDGDRRRALIDQESGRILSAKRVGDLLMARAVDDTIELPDGTVVAFDDPGADEALSQWIGRAVELSTPVEGQQPSYQMTFDPPNDGAEFFDIPVPAGTFLDLAPVHLITTATLAGCATARPDLDWDVRRFRPNLVLRVEGEPFVEEQWCGRHLGIGKDVVLDIMQPTVRCAMPLRPQPGLRRQPELFAAMNDLNRQSPNHLGVYAQVANPGPVRVGDPVMLAD